MHTKKIITEGELDISVGKDSLVTAQDGKKYNTKLYNLDMIISIGYRVNSKRGVIFRKWVANVLRKYISNGYSINEKRCLSCQENLINLNNKVNYLLSENDNNKLTMEK